MDVVLPVAATLFLWWFSTGTLLLLVRLPRGSHVLSLTAGALLMGAALAAIEHTAGLTTTVGVYVGFVGALAIWGWLEMAYLTGFLTGPERRRCPEGLSGLRRFVRAVNVGLYQEVAVIIVGVLLLAIAAYGANPIAAWTFCTLWFMRWSAKLNLYLGVANVDSDLIPEQLRYTVSYMGKRAMNWLFPVSVTVGTAMVLYHGSASLQEPPGSPAHSAALVLATLTALGVVEHWFLVLPFRDSVFWRWMLPAQAAPGEVTAKLYHGA